MPCPKSASMAITKQALFSRMVFWQIKMTCCVIACWWLCRSWRSPSPLTSLLSYSMKLWMSHSRRTFLRAGDHSWRTSSLCKACSKSSRWTSETSSPLQSRWKQPSVWLTWRVFVIPSSTRLIIGLPSLPTSSQSWSRFSSHRLWVTTSWKKGPCTKSLSQLYLKWRTIFRWET